MKRNDESFERLWQKSHDAWEKFNLKHPKDPRTKRIPKRLEHSQSASERHKFSAHDLYKTTYYETLDMAMNEIKRRFDQPAYKTLQAFENVLLRAATNDSVEQVIEEKDFEDAIARYEEFDLRKLKLQLQMLGNIEKINHCKTLSEVIRT